MNEVDCLSLCKVTSPLEAKRSQRCPILLPIYLSTNYFQKRKTNQLSWRTVIMSMEKPIKYVDSKTVSFSYQPIASLGQSTWKCLKLSTKVMIFCQANFCKLVLVSIVLSHCCCTFVNILLCIPNRLVIKLASNQNLDGTIGIEPIFCY